MKKTEKRGGNEDLEEKKMKILRKDLHSPDLGNLKDSKVLNSFFE